MKNSLLINVLNDWRIRINDINHINFSELCRKTKAKNGWFTKESISLAFNGINRFLDAEKLRSLDGLHHVGAVDQHLGGDAAAVQAGAAEGAFFNHRHVPAGVGRIRRNLQAGAGADNNKVKLPHHIP